MKRRKANAITDALLRQAWAADAEAARLVDQAGGNRRAGEFARGQASGLRIAADAIRTVDGPRWSVNTEPPPDGCAS